MNRRYTSSTSAKSKQASSLNPEVPVVQVVKMQNLLEEYDRENQYLNKQVMQLLSRNRALQSSNLNQMKQRKSRNNWLQQRESANEGRRKKAFDYFRGLERSKTGYNSSTTENKADRKNFDAQSRLLTRDDAQSRLLTREEDQKIITRKQAETKQVKFTKDPYIELSDVRTVSPEKPRNREVDEQNSPLKRKSSIKKSGVEILSKSQQKNSSKKQQINAFLMSESKLSGSRKSGVRVISKEGKEEAQNKKQQINILNNMSESKLSVNRKSGVKVVSKQKNQKNNNNSDSKLDFDLSPQKQTEKKKESMNKSFFGNQSLSFSQSLNQDKSTSKKEEIGKAIENKFILEKNKKDQIFDSIEQIRLPIVPITPERRLKVMERQSESNFSSMVAIQTQSKQNDKIRSQSNLRERNNEFGRILSQHRIEPSQKINYDRNVLQRQDSRGSMRSRSKTGKFINVVTRDLVKDKLNK